MLKKKLDSVGWSNERTDAATICMASRLSYSYIHLTPPNVEYRRMLRDGI